MKFPVLLSACLLSLNAMAQQETLSCPSTPYILSTPEDYDHGRYAPAEIDRFYDGGSFIASVDGEDDDNHDGHADWLAQPAWVAYHLKAYESPRGSKYAPSFKRPSRWYRTATFDDERLEFGTNKRMDDSYRGDGKVWNRGHLAQRADANRLGPEYGCNTHVFENAIPQAATLNQGIWLGLENYISSLANEKGEVWVVTGPVHLGAPFDTIGDVDEIPVPIPDAVFKVVFMETEQGVQALSFMYPNKYEELPTGYLTGSCQRDKEYDHTPYITSLDTIEQLTGLTFFADVEMDLSEVKQAKATGLPAVNAKNEVGYCS